MNYCIIINDFKSGGAQKATVDLINALLAKKIKLTVIVFENTIHFDLPKDIGFLPPIAPPAPLIVYIMTPISNKIGA